jgi:5'-nucleotidase
MRSWFIPLTIAALTACAPARVARRSSAPAPRLRTFATTTITIVGTNDLHGHIGHLPEFAGYMNNIRKVRAKDGGVLLVDAGDMFQGTLESNQDEGAAVVDAYNALGYTAAAIGNHEFDYGPVGDADPRTPGSDARGALKARAAQAKFPFLNANVTEGSATLAWPNVHASVVVQAGGVDVGIIGVTSIDTPHTTAKVNFAGLGIRPLLESVSERARELRKSGASIIVVTAHAGGGCKSREDPMALGSCDSQAEIFKLAERLDPGLVDIIVAGHTHQAVAHKVAGIAIIESFARGRAFGRVDVTINTRTKEVTLVRVHRPQSICEAQREEGTGERSDADGEQPQTCATSVYEGEKVERAAAVAAVVDAAIAKAAEKRNEPLGVRAPERLKTSYLAESSLGNLLADLIRDTRPGANVGVMNGGGIRSHLSSGNLLYGQLYEIMPFDNRLVTLKLPATTLRKMVVRTLKSNRGIASISGLEAIAKCNGNVLDVTLLAPNGNIIADDAMLTVVTSDFLAEDGDGMFGKLPDGAVIDDHGPLQREAVIAALKKRGTELAPSKSYFDPQHPRLAFKGRRPVQCP